jgi:hypothetical protein
VASEAARQVHITTAAPRAPKRSEVFTPVDSAKPQPASAPTGEKVHHSFVTGLFMAFKIVGPRASQQYADQYQSIH